VTDDGERRPRRPHLLLVTDLAYDAAGRRYGDEDVALARWLRQSFVVSLCHPLDAAALLGGADVVLVRNTGPVIHYLDGYRAFRRAAREPGVPVYNELTGRGDMVGKQYLVDLTDAGYPVIPTVADPADAGLLGDVAEYVVKPMLGADSLGLRQVTRSGLAELPRGLLIQPRIDFIHEVSFYFVDAEFHYALYAPDRHRRWELAPYDATPADVAWAQRFIAWNTIRRGIQRVDACRTRDGGLLLVELEDNNPYLSLGLVEDAVRERFLRALEASLMSMLR